MGGVGSLVLEDEQVYESGRIALLLSGSIEPGARLILTHVVDKFLNRSQDLIDSCSVHLIVRRLINRHSVPLDDRRDVRPRYQ